MKKTVTAQKVLISQRKTTKMMKGCHHLRLHAVALSLLIQCIFITQLVHAQTAPAATTASAVGDTVRNPVTNIDVTVVDLIQDPGGVTLFVVTSDNSVILTRTSIGDIIPKSDGGDPPTFTDFEVVGVTTNATSMLVETVDIRVATAMASDPIDDTLGVVGDAGGNVSLPPPSVDPDIPPVVPPVSTSGVINEVFLGASGGDGSDGGGFEVCDPTGIFGGCTFIGVEPEKGGDGKKPAAVNRTIASSYNGGNPITSTAGSTPGITLGSVGGDGGQGGDGIVVGDGAQGGNGGPGGDITVNNSAAVNVGGNDSYGLYVFSRAGTAGPGGDSIGLAGNGGDGGAARDGGTVIATNNATLTTSGNFGHAMRVFSTGGGAGNGGGGWGIVGGSGNGAVGGNGGSVTATNNGILRTTGNNANGILAQSIGGSGGDAGSAGGIVALGGVGSGGGNAGSVRVTNNGEITTTGVDSKGILAQSIGGGGGTGSGTGGLVALSGAGGQAGTGSSVTVTNNANGTITTTGNFSDAIYAQSIGGGGGAGGDSGGLVASGASGGGAGNAGTVTVTNHGVLLTRGNASRGILAQSIGGGGGSGGGTGGLVALSGGGGGAGNGSTVTVTNSGRITTGVTGVSGLDSDAIFAQSIGGGGGDGAGAGGLVASGGSGGGSGNGGRVMITNSGELITLNHDSSGIFAQSIGGGGGAGAGSGGLVALGGDGGGSGTGNTVTINNNVGGDISTFGDRSAAIFAQSVGGGGGTGAGTGGLVAVSGDGGGAGDGGIVRVTNRAILMTSGDSSRGIEAQSVGGGGGSGGGGGGLVALSGDGGGASKGKEVTVTNFGAITTGAGGSTGSESDAIFAQSVGGGGGSGAGSGGLVGVSGSGGGAGEGGSVTVTNSGALSTIFDDSFGIFAQSIGGGGGSGGGAGGLVALGGDGGGASRGGTVRVTNNIGGDILTSGDRSSAIHAQSIGGGGGNGAGTGGLVALSGAAGGAGVGGTVTVTNSALLFTQGDESRGIYAQSVGGGGGSGGGSGGLVALSSGGGGAASGGLVTVTNSGQIITGVMGGSGDNADAIFAQSIGGGGGSGAGGGGLVTIAGSGGGAGGGGSVTVTNSGQLSTRYDESRGIFAQSVGGGGGSGGGSGGLVALSGDGGGAAKGGVVRVTNNVGGDITTLGNSSDAIYAQSVGGGGGNGAAGGGLVALAGGAGGAGAGGDVTVTSHGILSTLGSDSKGIFAQSIGGGGGSGGGSGGLVALSGDGGGAGNGGSVTVTNSGQIMTGMVGQTGRGSSAIYAQSIGGGGGDGSASGGIVAIGGGGGGEGNGGVVMVTNSGYLQTVYNDSFGIFAESVGGGGGSGGEGGGLVALSGSGSSGGMGGTVTVINNVGGSMLTIGDRSSAIFAHSVGGGGGYGTASGGLVALGGNAGAGSDGGNVSVASHDSLTTRGTDSKGIFAQSVGGGGGSGGEGGGLVALSGDGGGAGDGGNVTVTNTGNINTGLAGVAGSGSSAIFAQSVGGGGGDGSPSGGLVAIGSDGGGEGIGGTVTVTNAGDLVTRYDDSFGIFAESTGGGGGSGGEGGGLVALSGEGGGGGRGGNVTVNNAFNATTNATGGGSITTFGDRSSAIFAHSVGGGGGYGTASGGLVALGGNGAPGSFGGDVTVSNDGALITHGQFSRGIYAQSVGGGGGSSGEGGGLVGLGGDGGGAGKGGKVEVFNLAGGTITTLQDDSTAIFAESVGGGGGDGVPGGGLVGLGGEAGGGEGTGGDVTVENAAKLTTSGARSRGIYAHSIGGGGGRAGEGGGIVGLGGDGGPGSAGGDVTVLNTADITTTGLNADGIYAQSVGGGGGDAGDSGGLVNLGGDSVTGGANGGEVQVTSRAAISTLGGGSKGIFAQSVGGGGGDGGSAYGVFVNIGGDGGSGSVGGKVTVIKGGTIRTQGVDSIGIHAQSVGGGGGDGGSANSGSLFAGLSIGGDGAVGGVGGEVNVALENYLDGSSASVPTFILTENERATGILAQSVGGGGGSGGKAIQVSAGAFVSLSVAIGGSGAGGGKGGDVKLTGSGNVTTLKNLSPGVVLQSVGGGGGSGGNTISGSLAVGAGASLAGSLALGGSAGDASEGGKVTADVDSIIDTRGDFSTGFLAQSVGGGGGNGGTTVAAAASFDAGAAAGIGVGIGGNAGGGGKGGIVDVKFRGQVTTQQAQSDGIVVQSIGGGGGNAGTTVAASIGAAGGAAANVSVGVGGDGGGGGDGDRTSAIIVADVATKGDGSDGVIVQSVGGGGGNSGLTVGAGGAAAGGAAGAINVGVGGSGEKGGDGGIVVMDYSGTLSTNGANATGILAQSVGGGGGNSGGTIAGGLAGAGGAAGTVNVSVGGDGGAGGDGGKDGVVRAVTASTEGAVSTNGENSAGIVIQSIGGGGGNGGYAIAGGLAGGGVAAGAIDVGLGGSGEVGGVGKEVFANIDSIVLTEQTRSTGVLVQSVGGGGGNGGFSVAAGLAGAGVGSGTVSVGLSGGGGDGNVGGDVFAFSRQMITTFGDQSGGFVAQSVGGGGGNGGFNVAASISGAGVGSGAIDIGLGGDGGTGNNSGTVTATVSDDVVTYGVNSVGIMAQSQAGGGGNASFNVAAGLSGAGVGSGSINVGLGGDGGASGDAGAVTLTVTNNVFAFGGDESGLDITSPTYFTDLMAAYTTAARPDSLDANSSGIIAQSIGGGGGNGGVNVTASGSGAGVGSGGVSVGLGGDGEGGGSGGKVIADITGQVLTVGNGSDGVLAQSVGGGGGNGAVNVTGTISGAGVGNGAVTVGLGGEGGAGSTGGEVDLDLKGSVYTFGDRARGVIAQSIGGGGGNGAINIGGTLAGAGTGSGDVTVAIGGSGGTGATSGMVNADVVGDITTTGDFSDGFIAQTVGGGGGNSAINVGAAISGAGTGNGSVKVGLGGTGGDGADSNVVNATYAGSLRTKGDFSRGMLVQSIGGGGGSASGNVAAGLSGAGTGNGDVTVGLGGDGGAAGDGGKTGVALAVTASARGQIVTLGDDSGAFIAQSIGGGGGSGGFNISASGSGAGTGAGGVAVGLGGDGSGGGDGKGVDADIFSNIFTGGDNSAGVLVQSVGGGGGSGGFNVTAALVGAGTGAGGVAVGLGGDSDAGGDAGQVNADASGTILTEGDDSAGFVAQSIGGGGGNGGLNVNVGLAGAGTGSGAVAVGLGGGGAVGGFAGEVYASTGAEVMTSGDNSAGVVAQSIGGGGGNGGFNVNVGGAAAGTGSGAIGVALGGDGAAGNDGNRVELTVDNNVTTEGKNSGGILAQSLGGGGGNGGFNVNVNVAASGKASGALGVGLGGTGDGGGNGGTVIFNGTGNVVTGDQSEFVLDNDGQLIERLPVGTDTIATAKGDYSSGIVIQSIGGGGGNGGFDVSVSGAASGKASGALSVGLGGDGGGGGNGGVVDSTYMGDIRTAGFSAKGLLVQSVGGGGGNGAFNVTVGLAASGTGSGSLAVGLGGSGEGGGFGQMVTSSSIGDVATYGDFSTGITAQSMGGGGGSGGFSIAGTLTAAKSAAGSLSVGLGGSGGGGGAGGQVFNTVNGDVVTFGTGSGGILAQSVGGGGGNGGFSIAGAISLSKTGSGALSVGIGGSGDDGGSGEMVTNTVTGDVFTQGDEGFGIVAQSIGGGGGSGGLNVSGTVALAKDNAGALGVGVGGFGGDGGTGNNVTNTVTGFVKTEGDTAGGILAQSLGGGGGNGGLNVTANITASKKANGSLGVGVGGFGGSGGLGMNVTNTVTGGVQTFGDNSDGIVAQSLGGGGGNGGLNVTGTLALSKDGSTGALGVGIGGFGADGGDSGVVNNTVTMTETFDRVTTEGDNSFGIIAQSAAGGGGNGGLNITGTITASMDASTGSLGVGIGGFGGDGGASDEVFNTVSGFVRTDGDGSGGILAQSLGGGGGNGGLNVTGNISASKKSSGNLGVGIGGFGGKGGLAADVTNTVTGGVETVGDNSDGIVAQSLGGGGGNGAINVTGSLSLSSKGSTGAIGVGIGGFGSEGGNSGIVSSTVTMTEQLDHVSTMGDNSSGIIAQSVGGGGGNGGLNVTGTVSASKKSGASIGIGVGGFGAGAGDGNEVSLSVDGMVHTQGSDSHGIVAQSIGGGGGNGGTNVSGSIGLVKSDQSATAVGASIGVGGFGGGGGDAKKVEVLHNGSIMAAVGVTEFVPEFTDPVTGEVTPAHYVLVDVPGTLVPESVDPVSNEVTPEFFLGKGGFGSHGLVAQSIGGGGGNGGTNVSGSISYGSGDDTSARGLVVGVGGFGGDGGETGSVVVDVTGGEIIFAAGAGRSAVLAQSIGGGGGDGGTNVSGSITSDAPLVFGIGGFGGDAGIGQTVDVDVAADIILVGADTDEDLGSAGILAQSIGGGGGNGGLNVSGAITLSKDTGFPSITAGIGGFGGTGASSGQVDVNHVGQINTSGGWSHGVMAQSIAGGGGNGGVNISGSLNKAATDATGGNTDVAIIAGVGGSAGAGADAGNVTVTQDGVVVTTGDYSRGVAAQSIGGGGGNGGMNITTLLAQKSSPVTVGVGGSGGGGGHAGDATVNRGHATNSTGTIFTEGYAATGIEASSIGGGGGNAGMNFNLAYTKSGKTVQDKDGFAANFTIGGDGAEAGNGANAAVNNFSDIVTLGTGSHGILSQSIGGGGGNANFNIGVSHAKASTSAPKPPGLKDKLVGKITGLFSSADSTGEASAADRKDNENLGFSLVVGGATGDGGFGKTSDVVHRGNITTRGDNAYGILSQSIGGGGGNVGMDVGMVKTGGGSLAIKIGREGGIGGAGGDVTILSDGIIQTFGNGSFGLLAQSIGNGGGNSSTTQVKGSFPSKDDDGEQIGNPFGVTIGLEGGMAGIGGTVTLNAAGAVLTEGDKAHAIFAQSVGGGGGNGGAASSRGMTAPVLSVAVGGKGGEGGVGGVVDVTSNARVRTIGEQAIGILAQSIGGAGGTGGASKGGGLKARNSGIEVNVGGNGGKGMIGNTVTVDNSGVIITSGVGSHSILAQSIGGGGGIGAVASNTVKKSTAKSSQRAVAVVGGTGGEGAEGGAVTVTNSGGIGSEKGNSVGILAQSIGGGGGNASSVVVATTSGTNGNNLSLAIGGNGGEGGAGGMVSVMNEIGADADVGGIITLGANSHAIMAMSIGGGGGNGSSTYTTTKAPAGGTSTTNSLTFNLGGAGAMGGTGGGVFVNNDSFIQTYGDRAHGVLAQSIGGGGGNGGTSLIAERSIGSTPDAAAAAALNPIAGDDGKAISISIGGSGGDGNSSGLVTVENNGDIVTAGDQAYGIYAQSVGGGGGDGGFSAVVSKDLLKNAKTDLATTLTSFALGGSGGDGADAGDVIVTNTGTIMSSGDDAIGIFAQSVGGGGGNTGASISSPVWTAASLVIDQVFGARDGSDGLGGTVTVTNSGDIMMTGDRSNAIVVQSINGGGGNTELFLDVSQQAAELGDDGFVLPDNGGDVDKAKAFVQSTLVAGGEAISDAIGLDSVADLAGDILSTGEAALGMLVQSVGGGGGSSTTNIFVAQDGDQTVDLEARLGGMLVENSGGGTITANRTGDLMLDGDRSQGGSVTSIGGGGGKVVVAVIGEEQSALQGPESVDTQTLQASAGGRSQANPAGSTAVDNIDLSASLNSVGGGFNNAGIVTLATPPTPTPVNSISFSASLGTAGGSLNNGGDVTMTSAGELMTLGDFAPGLVIQSIGGGGGDLSLSGAGVVDIGLGGIDGAAGDAGIVSFTNTGAIMTTGELSHGLVLQSIGGGGGLVITDTARDAITIDLNTDNSGDGKAVTLKQQGDINVFGERAYGVIAQSLGGGGGAVDDLFLGNAGGAGSAAAVNISLMGDAVTHGDSGVGVFGQSAGRLGADDVNFAVVGDIGAVGDFSTGLIGQSTSEAIAGGIGVGIQGDVFATGDFSVGLNLSLVGLDSTKRIDVSAFNLLSTGEESIAVLGLTQADNAEALSITLRDSIFVDGDRSVGVDYRSIGGANSGDIDVQVGDSVNADGVASVGVLTISQADGTSGNVGVEIGGDLTSIGDQTSAITALTQGGDASGTIEVNIAGNASIAGLNASGLDLQSQGGTVSGDIDVNIGGSISLTGDDGQAIDLSSVGGASSAGSVALNIGGSAIGTGDAFSLIDIQSQAAGSAGNIDFALNSTLGVFGDNSTGLSLQSSGGSVGGNVNAVLSGDVLGDGDGTTTVFLSSTAGSGNSGNVNLQIRGDTIVEGDDANAIVLESLAAGFAGPVRLTLGGDVILPGDDTVAISATTRGSSGGNISINTTEGKTLFAGAGGNVVVMDGSASSSNTLTLNGPTLTADGLLGDVVIGTSGSDLVTSEQLFVGQFDLGGGTNKFINNGTLVAGPELSLGAPENTLVNNGDLIPGDVLNAQSVALEGSFRQTPTGVTFTELDFSTGEIDNVLATGTADLAGEIRLTLLAPELIRAGDFSRILYAGEQGVNDNGLTLITAPSVVITYDLTYPNPNQAVLDYNVDFSPDGAYLGQNLEEVGNYFNRIQAAGSSPALADTVIKMLYDLTFEEYRKTLSQMGPDFYGELQANAIHRGERFGHLLASGGGHRIVEDDYAMWFNYGTESGKHDSDLDYKRIDNSSDVFSVGFEKKIKENWMVGLGFTVEDHRSVGYGGQWQSEGDSRQLGFVLKHYQGNTEYAATLAYGWCQSDIERTGLVSSAFMANANRDLETFSGMLQVSHTVTTGEGYIRPTSGVGFTHLMADRAMETGAGALNLQLEEYDETHVWARLGVGLGRTFNRKSGNRINLRGDLGFQYYLTNGNTMAQAHLEGAPDGIDPMAVEIDLNKAHGYGLIGVEWIHRNGVSIGLDYSTILDSHSTVNRWDLGVRIPF